VAAFHAGVDAAPGAGVTVDLLYLKALDPRLDFLLARLGFRVQPADAGRLRAGATDVLDKSLDDPSIAQALTALRVDRAALLAHTSARRRHTRFRLLTSREREVFGYLVEGRTSREIAHALDLSVRTVEVHRTHIQGKLCARNIAELAGTYGGYAMSDAPPYCRPAR
jgi:FixJ family two-component response regulator